jgi:conjugal transfer pilus assembly protein TraD
MIFPLTETVIATLALLSTATVFWMPLGPWLAPELWPLTAGLSVTWLLLRAWLLDRGWRAYRAWRRNVVWQLTSAELGALDPQKAPGDITLGLAFPWTAAHTQQIETALATLKALPTAQDALGGHPALHVVGQAEERPLRLPCAARGHHTLLIGTTGSGKTELLEVISREVIHGPGAALILDPKLDRGLMARCAAEAQAAGKPFRCFLPAFPAASVQLNILATATEASEVASRIRALMPSAGGQSKEQFFEEFPLAIIENVAQAQQRLGIPWTLPGLFQATTTQAHFNRLLTCYLVSLGVTAKERKLDALIKAYTAQGPSDLLADALVEVHKWPREHYQKITGTLIPTFRGVVRAPLGPLLSAVPPQVTWDTISQQSMVVYAGLSALLYPDTANRIGRALLQDLLGYFGRRHAYEDCETAPPITVVIDEHHKVLYPGVADALAMARSAGGALILAGQSLSDTEDALGRTAAYRFLGNINTKIWLRLGGEDTSAKVATEGLGTCLVEVPNDRVGLGYGGQGGLQGDHGRTLVQREVPLVKPELMTGLAIGQGLVRMEGAVWKARFPLLTPVTAEEQTRLGLTAIWQTPPVRAEELEHGAGMGPALDENPDEGDDTCEDED